MRIEKLQLLAFGPFRGLELDLGAPGLHVVFGRNEAGKSTTLRAISGLLYGIPHRSPDAHTHKELRVGGVLDGVRIVRRKGTSNTLLDEEGRPIDEAVLLRLLRGVTKETFESAFGLDHVTLEAGAKALLEGRGDLGESLFDAAVGGGGDVQRLLRDLATEADAIYKPQGRALPLNDALRAFADAQRSVKEKQSLPDSFEKQQRAIEEAVAEKEAKAKERADASARKAAIERARKRVPLEKRRARAAEELASLGAIASHTAHVRSIAARVAAYDKTSRQRSELALEALRLRDRVADAARRAGVDAPDAALRVDAQKEGRIHRFVSDRGTIGERLDAARIELARTERELARLRPSGEAARTDELRADALRAAVERARPHAALEAKHASDVARATKRRAALDVEAAALGLFTGDAAALAALRVPAVASVERLAARAADAERAASQAAMRAADLDAQAAGVERQLAEHRGDFAPPDAAALRDARDARDAAWQELDASSAKSRSAYERSVRAADDVADRMIREADRVTTIARLRELARTYTKQRDDARIELARLERERAALDGELRTLFAPIAPLGFAEMRAWLERRARIVERLEELREAEREIEETARAIAAAKEELVALGQSGERLADQIAHASRRLADADAASRDAAAAARLEEQLEERRAAIAKDEAALAEVRTKLAELVAPLGVPEDASADEIARALEAVRDLFRAVDDRAHAEARAELAAREAQQFEEEVARAVRELGADLDGLSAREAALALAQRAERAAGLAKDVADADAQLEGAEPLAEELERLASDPEAASRAIDELDVAIADLGDAVSRLDQQIGGLRSGLDRMRADSGAAEASAAAQEALARVRSHVERWARTKLAAVLLQREIERYREENQGPLLTRASQLFARLTANAFTGVRAGFDDHDRAALTCVRAGGAEVGVDGLSQGTRDQLYLALRLASLLRHAEISGPMPVVLDDVLIHFDDERSRAALVVLGEVAREMQIVFFTHHARLVELAKDALGAAVVVHELTPPAQAVDQRQWM